MSGEGDTRFLAGFEVERSSTAERVADDLREMILSGELPPGTSVREHALAEQLSVSRQAVREAIQRLVRAGLLEHTPYKGTLVRTLSEADAEDLYKLRTVLELAAVDAAIAGDEPHRAAISAAGDQVVTALRDGSYEDFLEADFQFHLALVGALDSPRIIALYDSLFGELLLLFTLSDRERDPALGQAERHREIAEAIAGGDRRAARRLVKLHLGQSLADACRQISSQQSEPAGA